VPTLRRVCCLLLMNKPRAGPQYLTHVSIRLVLILLVRALSAPRTIERHRRQCRRAFAGQSAAEFDALGVGACEAYASRPGRGAAVAAIDVVLYLF
jgi:hypothetical protein